MEVARKVLETVNPTCVGMDRKGPYCSQIAHGKPHVRGDGPASVEYTRERTTVNPTCVGMDQ